MACFLVPATEAVVATIATKVIEKKEKNALTVSAGKKAEMLHEMATAGVTMAVLVTAIWLVMLGVSKAIEKRPDTPQLEVK